MEGEHIKIFSSYWTELKIAISFCINRMSPYNKDSSIFKLMQPFDR